jgi:hypothetical protein
MKNILFFLAAMFYFFASLQFNDPDPMPWLLTYGTIGTMSALLALGETRPYLWYAILAGFLLSGIWMFLLLPDFLFWLDMGAPNLLGNWQQDLTMIELAREFLGLGICTLVTGYFLFLYSFKLYGQGLNQQAIA